MLKRSMIAVVVTLLITSHAYAQRQTGNQLYQNITSGQKLLEMAAAGYIVGIADMGEGFFWNTSMGVTNGQLNDVVRAYIDKNPEARHMPAHELVMEALIKAFPTGHMQQKKK